MADNKIGDIKTKLNEELSKVGSLIHLSARIDADKYKKFLLHECHTTYNVKDGKTHCPECATTHTPFDQEYIKYTILKVCTGEYVWVECDQCGQKEDITDRTHPWINM